MCDCRMTKYVVATYLILIFVSLDIGQGALESAGNTATAMQWVFKIAIRDCIVYVPAL